MPQSSAETLNPNSNLHSVARRHLQQWDQAAWNEVILSFLVGMGYEAPLRYRILPVDQFSNIGTAWCRAQSISPNPNPDPNCHPSSQGKTLPCTPDKPYPVPSPDTEFRKDTFSSLYVCELHAHALCNRVCKPPTDINPPQHCYTPLQPGATDC